MQTYNDSIKDTYSDLLRYWDYQRAFIPHIEGLGPHLITIIF